MIYPATHFAMTAEDLGSLCPRGKAETHLQKFGQRRLKGITRGRSMQQHSGAGTISGVQENRLQGSLSNFPLVTGTAFDS